MQHDDLRELVASYALDALPDNGAGGDRGSIWTSARSAPARWRRSARPRRSWPTRRPTRRAPAGAARPGPCARSIARRSSPAGRSHQRAVAAPGHEPVVAGRRGGARGRPGRRLRAGCCRPTSASSIRSCGRRGPRPRAAQRQLIDAQAQLTGAKQQLQRVSLTTQILASPDVIKVDLKGQPAAPRGDRPRVLEPHARHHVHRQRAAAAAAVAGLPVVDGDAPPVRSAPGLLSLDPQGGGLVVDNTTTPERPAAFAVTVEPAGGVPAPTGARVLVGAL